MSEVLEEKPRQIPIARSDTIKLREHSNNMWRLLLPPGVTEEDLKSQDAMRAITAMASSRNGLRLYDEVFALTHDESHAAWYLVHDVRPGIGLDLVPLRVVTLGKRASDRAFREPPGFEFHKSLEGKWFATRLKDGVNMSADGHNSKEECLRALLDHASVTQTRE